MEIADVKKLFEAAESSGGLEYIFALVRVDGMQMGIKDPFIELGGALAKPPSEENVEEMFRQYSEVAKFEEPIQLIANLVNCTRGGPYQLQPFQSLRTGVFPNFVEAPFSEKAREVAKVCSESGYPMLGDWLAAAYPPALVGRVMTTPDRQALTEASSRCRALLRSLLGAYAAARLGFKNGRSLHKLPRFEVLELLTNAETGLYGFHLHFSNGNSATFERHADSTNCTNVEFGTPLGFFVGMLDQQRDEWRVRDRRLCEVGLSGRYNGFAQWKPLVYPGDAAPLMAEAKAASADDGVQGAYFYILCTGHRVIEFVVRTSIELPDRDVRFSDKFFLSRCPKAEKVECCYENMCVYDGHLDLDSIDPEAIASAIAMIAVGVNRLAFAFGAAATWRLKYRMIVDNGACATPSREDLHVLDSLLRHFPTTDDASVLDHAIDWYNRGSTSRNVFMRFLCHYISLECVATAVADGHADLGLGYDRPARAERKQLRDDCIRAKHDALYTTNPSKFVEEAYFECVQGITEKVRRVVRLVFGENHPYVALLFERLGGHSLSDIRSRLAHGYATLLSLDDQRIVKERAGDIAEVAKAFLTRIIFGLKPGDAIPGWSGLHRTAMKTSDPRITLWTTDDRILPTKDWTIRPEWCD